MNKFQMGFEQCKELLDSYGISLQGQIVTELDDALQVVDELGYPVVLKALSSQIIHKSDVDVVFLNLTDRDAVKEAYSQIIKNAEQAGIEKSAGILVQTMAKTGLELFIGAKQDPSFGPVTMVGYGGRFVELFADAAPGIGILDALIMLSKTMAGRILDGFRGPRLDKGSVIDITMRLPRLRPNTKRSTSLT
jgi:3-hydroxypropionyl-CoA synthetase (ADP-forming)